MLNVCLQCGMASSKMLKFVYIQFLPVFRSEYGQPAGEHTKSGRQKRHIRIWRQRVKHGIIDIGSNTVRLLVYQTAGNGFEIIANEKHHIRLIGHVKGGRISDDGMDALLSALCGLQSTAGFLGVDRLHCFATAPFRAVRDAEALTALVHERTGLAPDVLSGEEEARLGVIGARLAAGTDEGLFVDLGGGSMEISLLENGEVLHSVSVDVGSTRLADRFVTRGLPSPKELARIKEKVDAELDALPWLNGAKARDMICMGGTARALFRVHCVLNGREFLETEAEPLDAAETERVYKAILRMGLDGLRLLQKYCSSRIFTFVPGVAALCRTAKKARAKRARLSCYGVREGYLMDRVLK